MSDQTRDELRAWINGLLKDHKLTPSGLAKKAGLATTTLTEFMHNDNSPMLSTRSIAKITHAGKTAPPLLAGQGKTGAFPGNGGDDAVPYHPQENERGDDLDAAVAALIAKRPSRGAWILRVNVLELAGYLAGDVAIVDLAVAATAGSVVCAQAYEWSRGQSRTVFRVFEPPYLVAAARDPELRKPLVVDNNQVVIKGVIIACLRVTS